MGAPIDIGTTGGGTTTGAAITTGFKVWPGSGCARGNMSGAGVTTLAGTVEAGNAGSAFGSVTAFKEVKPAAIQSMNRK
jgi:hypothetical protein